jgi:hypothetical protein
MNPTLAGWIRGTHTREPAYTGGRPGCQTGSISALEPSSSQNPENGTRDDGVEPGHTPRPRDSIELCMLLSFQRPPHLSRKVLPSQGYALDAAGAFQGRTDEYSALRRAWANELISDRGAPGRRDGGSIAGRGVRRRPAPHETICTVTVRVRGRSSKSIRTICCQVPRASEPSRRGTVTDGPITAARRWAWALESWLRRLWS